MGINFDTIFNNFVGDLENWKGFNGGSPSTSLSSAKPDTGTFAVGNPATSVQSLKAPVYVSPQEAEQAAITVGTEAATIGAASALGGAGDTAGAAAEPPPTDAATPEATSPQVSVADEATPTMHMGDQPGLNQAGVSQFQATALPQGAAYNPNNPTAQFDAPTKSGITASKVVSGVGKGVGAAGKVFATEANDTSANETKKAQQMVSEFAPVPVTAPAPVALQTANISDDNPMFNSIFGEYPRKKTKGNLLPPIIPPTTGQQ